MSIPYEQSLKWDLLGYVYCSVSICDRDISEQIRDAVGSHVDLIEQRLLRYPEDDEA